MKAPLAVLIVVSIIAGMLFQISFTNTSISIMFPLMTNIIAIGVMSSMCLNIHKDK